MKRFICAVALASLPTLIVAQAPANDRLNLELYLEYETVSDPQLSPDASQIIYTRGWVDKQNDRRESSLWIMNADGSKNRFLVRLLGGEVLARKDEGGDAERLRPGEPAGVGLVGEDGDDLCREVRRGAGFRELHHVGSAAGDEGCDALARSASADGLCIHRASVPL